MKRYLCLICGLIYDEAEGWLDDGIEPGTFEAKTSALSGKTGH